MAYYRTAAFFDFDNTLITGDSQGLEIEYLFRRRLIPVTDLFPIVIANFLFKRNLLSADRMVRTCLRIYRGRPASQPLTWADDLYRVAIGPRLSHRMVAVVGEHRRKGHLPVVLSASLPHLIEPAARTLGIDHVLSTRLEQNGAGVFTGKTEGPVCVGRHKTDQAVRLAENLGIDMRVSYVYSDHHADLDLFRSVGHPVAVSPTRRLLRAARHHHWTVMSA